MSHRFQWIRTTAATLTAFGLILGLLSGLAAADLIEIHVAPTGNVAADGSRANSVAGLIGARDAVRRLCTAGSVRVLHFRPNDPPFPRLLPQYGRPQQRYAAATPKIPTLSEKYRPALPMQFSSFSGPKAATDANDAFLLNALHSTIIRPFRKISFLQRIAYIADKQEVVMSILLPEKINQELAALPQWRRSNNAITRDFSLNNFGEALRLINAIGARAEAADHHPDLLLHGYRFVKVTLTTHSAGGLTLKDFELAREIDALFQQFAQA